jgi:hypothetical protein
MTASSKSLADLALKNSSWTPVERARAKAFYWALIAICLVFAGAGWYLIEWQQKPLHDSIPVMATIRRLDVMPQNDGHGRTIQHPVILYSYSVGGVVYTTDRVTPSTDVRDLDAVATLAKSLHEGQSITAHYYPAQPESAYLIRAHNRVLYALCAGPLLLAVILIANWPRVRRSV